MRSLDLTAKIRKNRSPASTPSPIPPSVVTCFGARSGARSLEAPEITPPSPPFPSSREQAEPASNATNKATSIRLFLMQSPIRPHKQRCRLTRGPLRNHLRHDLFRDVEVRVDFLHIVVLFEGIDQAQSLPRRPRVEVDAVLGLHGDLRVLVRYIRLAYGLPEGREILRGRHDPVVVLLFYYVFGPGFEGDLHQFILICRALRDQDDALALEQVRDRAGRTELAAVLGEDVANVGGGPVAVVRKHVDQDGDPAGRVALVGDPLVGFGVGACAGALVDGALDVVVWHVGVLRLLYRKVERRVHLGVPATLARGDGDRFGQLTEERPALGVSGAFLALYRRPFTVTAHMEQTSLKKYS